jgi:hypothetical protein
MPSVPSSTSVTSGLAMPAFLPDKVDGKNSWNNWLDSSAKITNGWSKVPQSLTHQSCQVNTLSIFNQLLFHDEHFR